MEDKRPYFFTLAQSESVPRWCFIPVEGFEMRDSAGGGIASSIPLQTWKVISTSNDDAFIKSGKNYILSRIAYGKRAVVSMIEAEEIGSRGLMEGPDLFELSSESLTPGSGTESMLTTVWRAQLLPQNTLEMAYSCGTHNMAKRINIVVDRPFEDINSFDQLTQGLRDGLAITEYEVVSSKGLTNIENFFLKVPH